MKNKTIILIGISLIITAYFIPMSWFQKIELSFGAPTNSVRYERTIVPETDSAWELGTSTKAWLRINSDEICLTGDTCETTWPSGTFSWTPATNYGENTNSTTTAIWVKENLYASSTIYAPNFTAESTTATSTFAGGLKSNKAVQFPLFANCNIDTDADGFLVCGSDSTGSAVGTVSTSTVPNVGDLAYWTSAGYPSLLGTVATSTIGAGTGLTFSGTAGYQVGGTNGTFSVNTSQNIATLSNLTGNGFVKTSGGVGTLSVDTNTYLTTVDISANTNLASTWPVILTGDTLSFGGLSTSTAAVAGNIPYFSGVNTFANVATTTLTGTAPMVFSNPISVIGGSASVLTCTAASGSVAGCLSAADWTTFNGKQAGDATLTALAGLTISAGSLITGTGADAFSVLAGGTGGYVLAMSGSAPTWVATTTLSTISGTLDISAQSNLTAGTGITLTNDDLSIDTSQNIATLSNLTSNGFVKTGGGAGTLSIDTATYLTTVDISANTNLAATAPVVLTGDTLSLGNVNLYPSFSYSTSTAWVATSTKQLGTATVAETWNFAECYTTVGTLNIQFSDGTNLMNMISASSTPAKFALTQNNSFVAGEKRQYAIGTPATSPVEIACTITKTISIN